jgi:hypothetical protein
MDSFVAMYNKELDKEFDGSVSIFRNFSEKVNQILSEFGMDLIKQDIAQIDDKDILKAIVLLNPLDGNVIFIHAKQYINKEDISFLVPLMINTGKMLMHNSEVKINSIILTTVKNEHLALILRERAVLVRFYVIDKKSDDHLLVLEFMKNKEKILKNQKKIENRFEMVDWGSDIGSIIFMDLLGKILFSKKMKDSYNFLEPTAEIVSFISSCRKASETIFNKDLFSSSITSLKKSEICINLKAYVLFATINNMGNAHNFQELRDISRELLKKV